MRSGRPRDDAGFTLIEMVVVLAIFALVIGLSVPAFMRSTGSAQLRPLTAQLAADLKLARAAAITQNRPISFVFDTKARTYQVQGVGHPVKLPKAVALSLATAKEASGEGKAGLIFFPDGSSTGGKLTLTDHVTSMTIRVEWLTGAVTAQRHL